MALAYVNNALLLSTSTSRISNAYSEIFIISPPWGLPSNNPGDFKEMDSDDSGLVEFAAFAAKNKLSIKGDVIDRRV